MIWPMPSPVFAPDAPAGGAGEGSTNGQPDSNTDNYKSRFEGLQGKYQQEKEKWTNETNGLKAQLADKDGALRKLTGDFEALNVDFGTTKKTLADLTGERDGLKASIERKNLIMSEFPDLAPLEAKGLLPNDVGDALKGKLTSLRDVMKTQGKQIALENLNTNTPPADDKTPPKTADGLLAEYKSLMRQGKLDEANAKYDEYLKVSN